MGPGLKSPPASSCGISLWVRSLRFQGADPCLQPTGQIKIDSFLQGNRPWGSKRMPTTHAEPVAWLVLGGGVLL